MRKHFYKVVKEDIKTYKKKTGLLLFVIGVVSVKELLLLVTELLVVFSFVGLVLF